MFSLEAALEDRLQMAMDAYRCRRRSGISSLGVTPVRLLVERDFEMGDSLAWLHFSLNDACGGVRFDLVWVCRSLQQVSERNISSRWLIPG